MLSWKTIDKLEAKVPGAHNSYKGETCEFNVMLGRSYSPLQIDVGGNQTEDDERFRIENKTLDIAVEAATLREAKQLLREKLAASEDFTGTWKLWMHVNAFGGSDISSGRYGEERAHCTIDVKYVVELTTGRGKSLRKRNVHLMAPLPSPFTGEFPVPKTHKELARLQNGGAVEKRERWNKDEVWVEATPELVETIRLLQKRLGESGDKVQEALSKKRFMETLEAVRNGNRLLSTSLVSESAEA